MLEFGLGRGVWMDCWVHDMVCASTTFEHKNGQKCLLHFTSHLDSARSGAVLGKVLPVVSLTLGARPVDTCGHIFPHCLSAAPRLIWVMEAAAVLGVGPAAPAHLNLGSHQSLDTSDSLLFRKLRPREEAGLPKVTELAQGTSDYSKLRD